MSHASSPDDRERATQPVQVSVTHLASFAETFADLDDPEVMNRAWG